jgi:hypothetical protein
VVEDFMFMVEEAAELVPILAQTAHRYVSPERVATVILGFIIHAHMVVEAVAELG